MGSWVPENNYRRSSPEVRVPERGRIDCMSAVDVDESLFREAVNIVRDRVKSGTPISRAELLDELGITGAKFNALNRDNWRDSSADDVIIPTRVSSSNGEFGDWHLVTGSQATDRQREEFVVMHLNIWDGVDTTRDAVMTHPRTKQWAPRQRELYELHRSRDVQVEQLAKARQVGERVAEAELLDGLIATQNRIKKMELALAF